MNIKRTSEGYVLINKEGIPQVLLSEREKEEYLSGKYSRRKVITNGHKETPQENR